MREIFENSNQLKIVHGNMEARALQRDFNIYATGIIDLQEAYHLIYGEKENAGLQTIVLNILGTKMQGGKLAQLADWRERPLNQELLDYASMDSSYILRRWYKMKDGKHDELMNISFENSKRFTELVYRFPDTCEPINLWNRNIKSLSTDLQNVFSTVGQRGLFIEMARWAIEKAKMVDRPIKDIIKIEE